MWKRIIIFVVAILLWPEISYSQSSPTADERPTRKELKQSVVKMTFESGDRRIIQLSSGSQSIQQKSPSKDSSSQNTKRQNIRSKDQITVQCNPLGEAEAIGLIPDTPKNFKDRGQPIDIFAPENSDLSAEKWKRIAELACLEDEI